MERQDIIISEAIGQKLPDLTLGCIQCKVKVGASDSELLSKITDKINIFQQTLNIDTIKDQAAIKATREAYLTLGKKPSRYRPSAEALMRRVLQGKGLYAVNNVVDLLNLVSVSTGFSIGGYDVDKIEGTATLGIGNENEPYKAIGRGELNIHNLPLFRDETGAFGSPTSDSARTMVTHSTQHFLLVIFGFGGQPGIAKATQYASDLLKNHAEAGELIDWLIS